MLSISTQISLNLEEMTPFWTNTVRVLFLVITYNEKWIWFQLKSVSFMFTSFKSIIGSSIKSKDITYHFNLICFWENWRLNVQLQKFFETNLKLKSLLKIAVKWNSHWPNPMLNVLFFSLAYRWGIS